MTDPMKKHCDKDSHDVIYTQGSQRAWLRMLQECIHQLGPTSPEANAERWRLERGDVVLKLREICTDHGDNDWPDDLHLADVLEKHLYRHLESQ